MNPAWPELAEDEYGVFFTPHEVDIDLSDHERLTNWILDTVEQEGFELNRLDFVFCSDEFLLEINRTHLDHDFYTDIITFPLNDNPLLAEIYISTERVKENAAGLHILFEDELHRVMIHGVLHLCGYNDHEEEDIKMMRKKEEQYLKKLGGSESA